ncbi:hypothetical protein IV417_18960 [Alphaproteobacteria bacterium KMM 3653]|uniref:Uncharacterized protein n=1 Tax=Harenicola maris TaxID=2841044 RepID=A0AAP2CUF2_9RHOB|nr:hypothetical protein [Harenicola maris]
MDRDQSFTIIGGVVAALWVIPWLVRPLGQDLEGAELITAMTWRGVFLLMAFGMFTVIRKHGTLLGVVFLISPVLGALLAGLGVGKTGAERRKAKRSSHVDPQDVALRLEALERKRAAAPKGRSGDDWGFLDSPAEQQVAKPAARPEPAKRAVDWEQSTPVSKPMVKPQPTAKPARAQSLRSPAKTPEPSGLRIKGQAKYDQGPIVSNRGLFGRKSKVI